MKNKKETQNVSVEELLEKMTLDEKLQQLTQLSGVFFDAADKTAATGPKEDVGISDNDLPGIGSTLNFRGAEQVRRIQEAHLEADRNKIPMLFMMDVIHGCRTIYPVNLGMGATFNPKLMEECSAMAAREARAMGVRVTLGQSDGKHGRRRVFKRFVRCRAGKRIPARRRCGMREAFRRLRRPRSRQRL